MTIYTVGYLIGSLSSTSINRILARALMKVSPSDLKFTEISIRDLPLYSPDYDDAVPPEVRQFKRSIAAVDALLIVTPEYNRSIPGGLKNAIDWASRPRHENSFNHIPAAVIGCSPGSIGTALAQQSLRAVLGFCNARQMTAPEAFVRYSPHTYTPDGDITDESARTFLTDYMIEFRNHIIRTLTVLPR